MGLMELRLPNPARLPHLGALFAAPLLAALLLASGCGQQAKLPPLAPDSVLLAFGDSLTYGTGANENESYPAQLEKLTGRRVVREGVPGEVSAAGLARLPAVLDEHRPRLLLLCHGGNDFLRRLPKAEAAANVRAMIRLAKSRGVDVAAHRHAGVRISAFAAGFLRGDRQGIPHPLRRRRARQDPPGLEPQVRPGTPERAGLPAHGRARLRDCCRRPARSREQAGPAQARHVFRPVDVPQRAQFASSASPGAQAAAASAREPARCPRRRRRTAGARRGAGRSAGSRRPRPGGARRRRPRAARARAARRSAGRSAGQSLPISTAPGWRRSARYIRSPRLPRPWERRRMPKRFLNFPEIGTVDSGRAIQLDPADPRGQAPSSAFSPPVARTTGRRPARPAAARGASSRAPATGARAKTISAASGPARVAPRKLIRFRAEEKSEAQAPHQDHGAQDARAAPSAGRRSSLSRAGPPARRGASSPC